MEHQLPEHVRLAFERIARTKPAPRQDKATEQPPDERVQRAEAILAWTWWLSRLLPRGLSQVSLYSAERLSLWLESSGEVKFINSFATAIAKGVVIGGPGDLQRVLRGEHLEALSEGILVGTIWDTILRDIQRQTGAACAR